MKEFLWYFIFLFILPNANKIRVSYNRSYWYVLMAENTLLLIMVRWNRTKIY